MTRKELQTAICEMSRYLVFSDYSKPHFDAVMEAAEAHLATLRPDEKDAWYVETRHGGTLDTDAEPYSSFEAAAGFVSRNLRHLDEVRIIRRCVPVSVRTLPGRP